MILAGYTLECQNLSRHCKALILRALADIKALLRPTFGLLIEVGGSIHQGFTVTQNGASRQ